MPRIAFAVPFLPHQRRALTAAAGEVLTRHASDHRQFLLDRGIFKERWWMQTGRGSPPLTLVLMDCDDVARALGPARPEAEGHGRWLRERLMEELHGIVPAESFRAPETELLSGTTTMATATAGTQTMFALPLPDEAVEPVRGLIARIEHGDLAQMHGKFLADSSIREEWIWLQHPGPGCPALLLVHWIGDDLDAAWQRLTFVRDDEYARVLQEALFRRLIGIPPAEIAEWRVEQLLAMHVRRSDGPGAARQRLARRLFALVGKGRAADAQGLLAEDVVLAVAGEAIGRGRSEVAAALDALVRSHGAVATPLEVMVGHGHAYAIMSTPDGAPPLHLLAVLGSGVVTSLTALSPSTPPPS